MRNSQDRYAYRHCKCISCGAQETIFWSMIVPTGIIIEAEVPCDTCSGWDVMLGDEVALQPVPPETYFNPADVLLH